MGAGAVTNSSARHRLELVRVDPADARSLTRFLRVPWHIYQDHWPGGRWVPPLMRERRQYLDRRRNPMFRHLDAALWTVRRQGREVGRIAAAHDADWERHRGTAAGSFGLFECTDDDEVAGALLDAAAQWLWARGRSSMLGPFDLTTNYTTGFLTNAFDRPPTMMMPYNPPYYADLMERAGLVPERDLSEWSIQLTGPLPERVRRVAAVVQARTGVTVRPMRMRDWDAEIDRLMAVYNTSWADNWGFVPLAADELRFLAAQLRPAIRPELALIAEAGGQPIGIGLCVLDLNPVLSRMDGRLGPVQVAKFLWGTKVSRRPFGARLILLGVTPPYRRSGAELLLYSEIFRAAQRLGVHDGTIGWICEDNAEVLASLAAMRAVRAKTYRVFRRDRRAGPR